MKVKMLFLLLMISATLSAQIIIDHTCTDFTIIPDSYLNAARSQVRIVVEGASHATQPLVGVVAIAGWNSKYNIPESMIRSDIGDNVTLGTGNHGQTLNFHEWATLVRGALNVPGNNITAVFWMWCGELVENPVDSVYVYLNLISHLEADFPSVKFVYATQHVWGKTTGDLLTTNNAVIRNYCKNNGKILYDFEDIERYDPDKLVDYLQYYVDDHCDYYINGHFHNWANDWTAAHSSSYLTTIANSICSECCAHSLGLNCVQKGGAFLWMLARLVGWDGGLPVQLTSFTGTYINRNTIQLKWTTLSETNNYGFDVLRKTSDVQNFSKIAFVSGNLTTLVPQQYLYTDINVPQNTGVSYKLCQIDLDGTKTYTEVVEVIVTGTELSIPAEDYLFQNYPNPFNPTTQIKYRLGKGSYVSLIITDILGKSIKELINEYQVAGEYTKIFDASALSIGTYFYTLSVNNNIYVKHMVVIK